MTAVAVRCVTFDLDDTLYLERDYVRSGFDAVGSWVLRNLAIDGFAVVAWKAFESGVRGRIFDAALHELGVEKSARIVDAMVDVYRRHPPVIELLPDARSALSRLPSGAARAVVTDGPLQSQRAKAEALGAHGWACPVVLTAELGEGFAKPDPRSFTLVEEATGWRAERCAYVADNPAKDFGGPRSLGWLTIRVRRSASLHESVDSGADVDEEVADLTGLAHLLAR